MQDLISAKKQKLNSWVVTLSLTAAAVIFYFFVFRPTETKISDLRRDIDEKRTFIESTDLMSVTIEALEADLQNAEHFVQRCAAETPTEEELPRLYRDINALMAKHQVATQRFDPGDNVAMKTLLQSPLSFAVHGDFNQVFGVLSGLDALPALAWVQNLSLKQDANDAGQVVCEASVVIFADNSEISD
ncbi:MAG: type 4a pilus biogenesis protein PilO [Planctomycetales bacterium]|nr:type 4a pilus biogenesis protein PilO [Planctomycetales bacterium]